jgi:hypothetical protein
MRILGEAEYRALKYGKKATRELVMLEMLLAASQGVSHTAHSSTDGSVHGPYFEELRPLLEQLDRLAAAEPEGQGFFPSADQVREVGEGLEMEIFHDNGTINNKAFSQPFDIACLSIYRSRRLYVTEKGYLGLGPASLSPGDSVWIIPGHDKPVVLRSITTGNEEADTEQDSTPNTQEEMAITGADEQLPIEKAKWTLIGSSYVHGIMNGEALGHSTMTDIILV